MLSFFRSSKGAAVIIGCLFVFLAFVIFGRRTERPRSSQASIGVVTKLVGHADRRAPRSLTFEPLEADAAIVPDEMIVVHEASQVTLGFGEGSLRLQPGARAVASRDPSHGANAIVVILLDGEADILTTSPLMHVVKDGKEVVGSTTARPEAAIVKGGARIFPGAPVHDVVVAATTPTETPAATPLESPRRNDEIDSTSSKDSLSNEEIRRAMSVETGFYRRCYLTYINRAKPAKTDGETLTVGFVIANSGQVRDAKLVRSTVDDAVLAKCVLETVERTPFRAFKGRDIPVLEFPIELK